MHTNIILLNIFGAWESEQFKDKRATDCHGQLHLCLTPEVAKNLGKEFDEMENKLNSHINYYLKNCVELETERLSVYNMNMLNKKVDSMEDSLNKIMKKLGIQ